ncbi:MAG: hypothetical protein EHM35_00545 [Planctomycetaceae bacterium]|nr:MAG: hypothetical protein EHM35_00545 [Planctomycetaceae bacterium]
MSELAFVVYDRKSPRHNWQCMVRTAAQQHAEQCARIWHQRATQTAGWEQYEQRTATFPNSRDACDAPDTLPRNHRWGGA